MTMWIPGHCWGCDQLRKTGHVIRWSSPHLLALRLHLKTCSPPHLCLAGRTTCFPLLHLQWLMRRQDPRPPLDHCHLQASQCCGHTSTVITPLRKVSHGLQNNGFHVERMVTQPVLGGTIHTWRLEKQIEKCNFLKAWVPDICVHWGLRLRLWPNLNFIGHESTQDQTYTNIRSLKATVLHHCVSLYNRFKVMKPSHGYLKAPFYMIPCTV